MSAQTSRQQSTSQAAINANTETRLHHLEDNYEKILLILRGNPEESDGKESVIGRLHTLEMEQSVIAKELSKHLVFHERIAEKVEQEERERKEFQQKIFFTLLAFLLSNIGVVLIVLRYTMDILTR